jgi:hypothetical protein
VLTNQLADCAREIRKYGVGWAYITQNIGSLNLTIFDMLGVRICVYGLGASDLRAMKGHIDSNNSLLLYLTFAKPEQTSQHPYMIAGPFSPLSVMQTPLFVTTFRPNEWMRKNEGWIREQVGNNGMYFEDVRLTTLKDVTGSKLKAAPMEKNVGRPANDHANADPRSGPNRIQTSLPHSSDLSAK